MTRLQRFVLVGVVAPLFWIIACGSSSSSSSSGGTGDTCTPSGGRCECACGTGERRDSTKACPQDPNSERCSTVCCVTGSSSSDGGDANVGSDAGDAAACAPGTCRLGNNPCEAPTGQLGNGCCACGADGTCSDPCKCASPDTPIATGEGDREIGSLRAGDLVYSRHKGAIVLVPVLDTAKMFVPTNHTLVEVTLEGGTRVAVSGGHPTADGRAFARLRSGDRLDGRRVESVREVRYGLPFTVDILPESDSATYFAAGVLVGSTLRPPPPVVTCE